MIGLGTLINALAILIGGIVGLTVTRQISPGMQGKLKTWLAIFTVAVGIKMLWAGFGGSIGQIFKQFGIMFLALILGNLLGKAVGIQKSLNGLGQYASERFQRAATSGDKGRASEGFITCSLLFCVGPMAILGAVQDGLTGDWKTLGIKAAMDGVATMTFAAVFGWGVLLSIIPVVAYQGTITIFAYWLAQRPYFHDPAMLDSVNATGGMLVLCLPLIIFEMRKVPLADYLPALVVAPLLTWWWH